MFTAALDFSWLYAAALVALTLLLAGSLNSTRLDIIRRLKGGRTLHAFVAWGIWSGAGSMSAFSRANNLFRCACSVSCLFSTQMRYERMGNVIVSRVHDMGGWPGSGKTLDK